MKINKYMCIDIFRQYTTLYTIAEIGSDEYYLVRRRSLIIVNVLLDFLPF